MNTRVPLISRQCTAGAASDAHTVSAKLDPVLNVRQILFCVAALATKYQATEPAVMLAMIDAELHTALKALDSINVWHPSGRIRLARILDVDTLVCSSSRAVGEQI